MTIDQSFKLQVYSHEVPGCFVIMQNQYFEILVFSLWRINIPDLVNNCHTAWNSYVNQLLLMVLWWHLVDQMVWLEFFPCSPGRYSQSAEFSWYTVILDNYEPDTMVRWDLIWDASYFAACSKVYRGPQRSDSLPDDVHGCFRRGTNQIILLDRWYGLWNWLLALFVSEV